MRLLLTGSKQDPWLLRQQFQNFHLTKQVFQSIWPVQYAF